MDNSNNLLRINLIYGLNTFSAFNSILRTLFEERRNLNFPETISENLAKYILEINGYNNITFANSGDLLFNDITIEVKCFSSSGPTSFGPTEKWNWILFIDATRYNEYYFKCYLLKLSNDSEEFKNLKINRTETFNDQAQQGKRPRIGFNKILEQFNDHVEVIFDGFL